MTHLTLRELQEQLAQLARELPESTIVFISDETYPSGYRVAKVVNVASYVVGPARIEIT